MSLVELKWNSPSTSVKARFSPTTVTPLPPEVPKKPVKGSRMTASRSITIVIPLAAAPSSTTPGASLSGGGTITPPAMVLPSGTVIWKPVPAPALKAPVPVASRPVLVAKMSSTPDVRPKFTSPETPVRIMPAAPTGVPEVPMDVPPAGTVSPVKSGSDGSASNVTFVMTTPVIVTPTPAENPSKTLFERLVMNWVPDPVRFMPSKPTLTKELSVDRQRPAARARSEDAMLKNLLGRRAELIVFNEYFGAEGGAGQHLDAVGAGAGHREAAHLQAEAVRYRSEDLDVA